MVIWGGESEYYTHREKDDDCVHRTKIADVRMIRSVMIMMLLLLILGPLAFRRTLPKVNH